LDCTAAAVAGTGAVVVVVAPASVPAVAETVCAASLCARDSLAAARVDAIAVVAATRAIQIPIRMPILMPCAANVRRRTPIADMKPKPPPT
jgi:hypothetical protein